MRQSGFALLAFVFFDKAVGEYYPPFYARTTEEGVRQFSLMIEDQNSVIAKRPGDFQLYLAGQFMQDSGKLVAVPGGPVLVEQALELVKDLPASKVVLNRVAEQERLAYKARVDGEMAKLTGGGK